MARRRRLAPMIVVSSGKFVRVVISPLCGYLGVLVFECRDYYPACDHLLKPLKNFGSC
jgi:hypothetical protein